MLGLLRQLTDLGCEDVRRNSQAPWARSQQDSHQEPKAGDTYSSLFLLPCSHLGGAGGAQESSSGPSSPAQP